MEARAAMTYAMIEQALTEADATPLSPPGDAHVTFPGPINPRLVLAIENLWEKLKDGVRVCFRGGSAVVEGVTQTIEMEIHAIQDQFGEVALLALEGIRSRVSAFYSAALKASLNALPAQVKIGLELFTLNSVAVSHKMTIGGEVAAAITQALKFTAGGEVSVQMSYAPQGSSSRTDPPKE